VRLGQWATGIDVILTPSGFSDVRYLAETSGHDLGGLDYSQPRRLKARCSASAARTIRAMAYG